MKNVRQEILNGDIVAGACCDISDPSAVEALGYAGWDFVLINAEGGTLSPYGAELENMIRAAYKADVAPAVKVPENDPSMIGSALKMGAKLIEVPMVSTREDAERALQAAHYPPDGERMTYWGVPDTGLTRGPSTSSRRARRPVYTSFWKTGRRWTTWKRLSQLRGWRW